MSVNGMPASIPAARLHNALAVAFMVAQRMISNERLFLRLDEDRTQGPESEAPAGTLRALAFDASLRGDVAHILAYRETIAPDREVIERVLPDGAVRLVFNIAGVAPAGRGGAAAPSALLIGAHVAPALVRLRGTMDGLSITLRPGATQALFGVPAGAIAGTTVPLEVLWRSSAHRLLEGLSMAPDDRARVLVLRAALLGRWQADRSASALVTHAMSTMRNAGGLLSVRHVAATLGIGERRLQQLFDAHVGLSPRTFGRLARLQAMLRALRRRPSPAWADLAAASGYYDQAHLANEFRALCGLTPGEFARRTISPSSKTAA
jgi:AraC-like DNA-binding protein